MTSLSLPCALAIGGLDPGGGAGIVADLRAFAAAGAFGCAAVALMTVQSTAGLRAVRTIPTTELVAQVSEVLAHQRVRAIKVGALGSGSNIRGLARLLGRHRDLSIVVDTPILPTRGRARLLSSRDLRTLGEELLPLATLVTLNLPEVQALLGERVRTVGEAHDAARALVRTGVRAVLVKGGHMEGAASIDVLAIDGEVVELRAKRLDIPPTHGTGCTFASLVAGRLALAEPHPPSSERVIAAIRWAKRVHHGALGRVANVGDGMRVVVL